MRGLVLDSLSRPGGSAAPLAGAEVWVEGSTVAAVTDRAGRFALLALDAGPARLEVRALGYAPADVEVATGRGVTLTLRPVTAVLPDVRVRAAAPVAAVLGGYEERRRTGMGHYLTREQIVARNAVVVSDVFTLVPGLYVRGGVVTVQRPGVGPLLANADRCVPAVYVDGVRARGPVDELVESPELVHGIEVYKGVGATPPRYGNENGGCGVILIWTRRGATVR